LKVKQVINLVGMECSLKEHELRPFAFSEVEVNPDPTKRFATSGGFDKHYREQLMPHPGTENLVSCSPFRAYYRSPK
jgi:hypothetical protein